MYRLMLEASRLAVCLHRRGQEDVSHLPPDEALKSSERMAREIIRVRVNVVCW